MSDWSRRRLTTGRSSFKIIKDFDDEKYESNANLEAKRRRSSRIEESTKIFASMCPDEILDHYDDYESRIYYTTLMLGDVSGFTELTEKYTTSGKGGPSRLTETLNSYIGAMVQEILSHDGDVLKFSGDAFIVMWKVQDGMVMRDVAVEAMQTACIIQKHFGSYETDVGVTLRVKLAIASGKIFFTSIGDPLRTSHYIITGKPVWDVKFAEALCRGGDILVAPSSWQWANPNDYVYETLPDGVHTLIISSSVIWETSKEPFANYTEEFERYDSIARQSVALFPNYSTNAPGTLAWQQTVDRKTINENELLVPIDRESNFDGFSIKQIDYSLRPKVIKAAKKQLKNSLRSYMLRPVVRSVELDEPIEYLTEMRQVVIVFVNVVTSDVGMKKLILMVDAAYKLVCGIVGNMQGCVNKTSLFDKDLMFLCIFGLRGDKHELESQIGLRCATKVRESLNSMSNVKSVTVGVTTGMTYCGVVGHILRREYTVIGMTVNKAARLMCAYSDKVICDRESFLHSRLEARHFILQDAKQLKGMTNVGPVYEFLEQIQFQRTALVLNKYPILGRQSELKSFRSLLISMKDHWKARRSGKTVNSTHNTLIIRGEPRMGKSRLLDEMTYIIPSEIPCNHITLVSSDCQAPYTLTHLIFSVPLGFRTTASSPKEREDKLLLRLGKIRYPHYLCALNQAFNVNFNITSRYQSLAEHVKHKLLRKLIARLVHGCFRRLWVVIVDDAENTDAESLSLLATLVRQDRILFVLSFGRKIVAETHIDSAIIDRARVIELVGIDKWYHAALACQILNVIAIPPELEKVIQERSMGNPGWIESYLVSLMQAGGLVLRKISMNNLRGKGLVIPPAVMTQSRSTSRTGTFKTESENVSDRFDRWKMYKTSYGDSTTSVMEKTDPAASSSQADDDKIVTICLIPRNFVLEDVDAEITMDVMTLKLFDSLTPLDQFLLKCASVLGETVNRNMLEKLMEGTTLREIACSVTKLFEIKILGCAAGDFVRSPGPIVFSRHVGKRNTDGDIRCGCTGLQIRESLEDLPKYASCGLMRFKMSLFRDTTYRLLTDHQKVDFHTKALKYLRQNTRRCVSCGGGPFTKLLGKVYLESDKNSRKKSDNFNYIMDLSDYGAIDTSKEKESVIETTDSTISDKNDQSCITTICRDPMAKTSTRTFSNIDFGNCQCHLILNTVYSQMLEHCRGIERKDKTLTAIIEFVEVLLAASNVPQARKLLHEAEEILAEIFVPGREDELITLPYLTGKIKTLQGRCNLESGLIVEASSCLEQAVVSLGYNFPKSRIMARCKSKIMFEEQKLMLTCLRDWKVGLADGDAANYNDQLAKCLAEMFVVFRIKDMQEHARLAAVWGLNAALASNKDFFALCTAYSNMMTTADHYRYRSVIPFLENNAMKICNRRSNSLEMKELQAVAQLYCSIFFSRWLRGEIVKASSLGFVTLKIARSVRSVTLRLTILPGLIHLLITECRHDEVVMFLRELEFISNNDMDKSGRTWYYALCVDFQLESGITLIPFEKCEKYYQEERDTMINLRDPEAERRYFTSMWLWCVRMEEWESATVWRSKKISATSMMSEHTVVASITSLKKVEGLLIYYVYMIDNRNSKAETTLKEIQNQFKIIHKLQKIVKVILARYLLMKAYYNMVCLRSKAGLKLLQRSKKIAEKMGNRLIYDWANHCEKAWTGSLSVIQRDFWKETCDRASPMSWHNVGDESHHVVPYTLPLPCSLNNF